MSQIHGQSDAAPTPPPPPPPDLSLTPPPPAPVPSATFIFHDGKSDKHKPGSDHFERVGLKKREKVDIELQFPAELANAEFTAQSLDGAELTLNKKASRIPADGSLSLRLKVEDGPGLYRVVVTAGGASTTLQFWVDDSDANDA